MVSPTDDELDPLRTADDIDDAADALLPPIQKIPRPAGKEEIDLWWGGYASRTMMPETLSCLLATGMIVTGAILLVHYGVPAVEARLTVYALAGVLWLIHILRWLNRAAGYTYRLTTHRLYCTWGILAGLLHRHVPPVELARVTQVVLETTPVERLLNIGRVRLEMEGGAQPVELLGLFEARHVAEEIGRFVKACRESAAPPG